MILVTVGTQVPFDRLVDYVEQWIQKSKPDVDVVAQVGKSKFQSEIMTVFTSVEPKQFEEYITQCDFIISHAGMGSILTALRVNKPIIIFPRKASLGEHRNDHQLATIRSFSNVNGIYVAKNQEELNNILDNSERFISGALENSVEYEMLLTKMSRLIESS